MASEVPFCPVNRDYSLHEHEYDAAFKEVMKSGAYINGPAVTEVESELCKLTGAKHAVACSNGTDALKMCLLACGIGAGDEVIVPTFTWISTAEVVSLVGATPVFADVASDECNLTLDSVKQKISSSTKAVIVVSLYGQMPAPQPFLDLAAENGITIIEDAAQSFGARRSGFVSCNWAHMSTTSFFPTKPLGCFGDGGAVFTNDDAWALKLQAIRTHGANKRHHHWCIGLNGRLDTLQAKLLLVKLRSHNLALQNRQRVAAAYIDSLRDLACEGLLQLPNASSEENSIVYAQFVLQVEDRQAWKAKLAEHGVPTAVYYPKCLHQQPCFKYSGPELPVAERLCDHVLALPMHALLTKDEVRTVIGAIRTVAREMHPGTAVTRTQPAGCVVVGTGYWGINHVRTLSALGRLRGVCDTSEVRLASIALEVEKYTSLDDALADELNVAFTVATPAVTHKAIVSRILGAGRHVLVEKPMCLSLDDAMALRDLAASARKVLAVGHLLRYHGCVKEVLRIVQGGHLGTIRHINAVRHSMGKFRTEEDIVQSFAPHDVSIILALANARPTECAAVRSSHITCGNADHATLSMKFASGLTAFTSFSWCHPKKEQCLTIVGEKGVLVFDDVAPAEEKLKIFPPYISVDPDGAPVAALNSRQFAQAGTRVFIWESESPLTAELRAFTDVAGGALGREHLPADADEGVLVTEVLESV